MQKLSATDDLSRCCYVYNYANDLLIFKIIRLIK